MLDITENDLIEMKIKRGHRRVSFPPFFFHGFTEEIPTIFLFSLTTTAKIQSLIIFNIFYSYYKDI
jgi:hypothetical protein